MKRRLTMHRLLTLSALLSSALLTGCASTAVSTSQATPTKSVLSPALLMERPGTGKLTIKRDSGFIGSACSIQVLLDGKPLANLDTAESVTLHLEPKEYIVGAKSMGICGGGDAEAGLIIKAGELRTYRISIDQGMSIRLGPTAQ